MVPIAMTDVKTALSAGRVEVPEHRKPVFIRVIRVIRGFSSRFVPDCILRAEISGGNLRTPHRPPAARSCYVCRLAAAAGHAITFMDAPEFCRKIVEIAAALARRLRAVRFGHAVWSGGAFPARFLRKVLDAHQPYFRDDAGACYWLERTTPLACA